MTLSSHEFGLAKTYPKSTSNEEVSYSRSLSSTTTGWFLSYDLKSRIVLRLGGYADTVLRRNCRFTAYQSTQHFNAFRGLCNKVQIDFLREVIHVYLVSYSASTGNTILSDQRTSEIPGNKFYVWLQSFYRLFPFPEWYVRG